jgi:glycine oxidase
LDFDPVLRTPLSAKNVEKKLVLARDIGISIGKRLAPAFTIDASESQLPTKVDVAVIGGGVVGLSIAWRLACRGLIVAVFDRGRVGAGTSLAATGMLAAAAEHEPGGEDLLALGLESQALWPKFRDAVETDSGFSLGYRDEGTLLIALGRDELDRLRFRFEHQKRSGLDVYWLSGNEARALEPGLRPGVTGCVLCRHDHQVDPRQLIPALVGALRARAGRLIENCPVSALDLDGGRVVGVITKYGLCRAKTVIAATGVWSADGLLPSGIDIPVRPIKGQSLALRMRRQTGMLQYVVWTEQVHLAPKDDGQLIVGATMEEVGFNPSITAGGMLALLDGLHRALPSSEEMEIEAIWSGFRPTSDDDAPILSETSIPGLLVATGHHRNGILLAPVTAHIIETMVTGGPISDLTRRFGLERFCQSKKPQAARGGRK